MLRVTLKGLLAHKVRLVATAVAVVLGVAFMAGTQVLTTSLSASFDKVFADVYASLDVVVRSSSQVDTPFGSERARVDASLLPTVQAVPGVEAAEGQVVAQIRVLDREGEPLVRSQGPPNVGLNWLTSPALNGWSLVDGSPPEGADRVVLDAKTAADGGYAVGDTVAISVTGGVRPFTVAGIARFGDLDTWGGAQAALFDTSTAQQIVGEPGRFDWISVAGDGMSQASLRDAVAAAIPPGTEALTGAAFTEESQDAFQRILSVFNTFLLTFALIALFVGSFIIYNTFSIIVAQRTRELALLRAVGASRGQVLRSVLLEALLTGVAASAVGVLCGIGLASGLSALLRNLGFAGPETPLVVPVAAMLTSLAVGAGVTVVAAFFPARRAATIAPVAAMRDPGVDTSAVSRIRLAVGVGLAVGGAWVAWAGVVREEVRIFGFGAFVVLMAAIVLGPHVAPRLSTVLATPLPRLGVEGVMARENARRSPRRTAATASALMIGVALVAFISVTASSVKASTADAIGDAVDGQFVITTDGFGPTALPPTVADEVRQQPGVAVAAALRGGFATIDGRNRLLLATDPAALAQVIEFDDVAGSFADLGPDGIAVTSQAAADMGLSLGDPVTVTFQQGATLPLVVRSVYETRFPLRGAGWIVGRDVFDANVAPAFQTDSVIYVQLDDPSPEGMAAARPGLEAIVDPVPGAELQDLGEYERAQTAQADQFLLVVYVLLALSLVIAMVGVVNTLVLSVTERTRELGLLRAVGMTRRQVRSSVRWEALLIAMVGTVLGLALGVVAGWALVGTLRADGITSFSVPWRQILVIIELTVIAGIAAATYPAWRAGRLDVLEAIATE